MKNSRTKGILYFALFILALLFVGTLAVPGGNAVNNISSGFNSVIQKLGLGGLLSRPSYSPTVVTQPVVQEESQVIDVVNKVSPAVVSIVVRTTSFDPFTGPTIDESGIGTGFIVDKNGLVITDSHVVDSESGQYSVILKDGTTYDVNKIHLDRQNDLAILEIAAHDLPTVELGDSDRLQVGQKAIAIGNALGQFQNTVTVGVVSGLGRSITANGGFGTASKFYENVIQTDAAINPGNSGGPLLNISGQVIGINVATSTNASNISFAIPVNILKPTLQSFLTYGRIVKPYLGVSYQMIDKGLAQLRGFPEGAFILSVSRDAPADKAGIQRGDIITKFNGQAIGTNLSLSRAIASQKVGDSVTLEISRNGQTRDVNVVLAEMPQNM